MKVSPAAGVRPAELEAEAALRRSRDGPTSRSPRSRCRRQRRRCRPCPPARSGLPASRARAAGSSSVVRLGLVLVACDPTVDVDDDVVVAESDRAPHRQRDDRPPSRSTCRSPTFEVAADRAAERLAGGHLTQRARRPWRARRPDHPGSRLDRPGALWHQWPRSRPGAPERPVAPAAPAGARRARYRPSRRQRPPSTATGRGARAGRPARAARSHLCRCPRASAPASSPSSSSPDPRAAWSAAAAGGRRTAACRWRRRRAQGSGPEPRASARALRIDT